MTVEKLRRFPAEPQVTPTTPRCEAVIAVATEHERNWRINRYGESEQPFQCTRPSVVKIQGQYYCRLHGGHKALDLVLSGVFIEKDTR
jgi:hypothetical protein